MADNDNTQLVEVHATELSLAGSSSISELQSRMQHMQAMIDLKRQFLKNNLNEGIDRDYAVIPGTNKNSLLKPGAEKLLDWHGFYASFEIKAQVEDWDRDLFAYTYRCIIRQRGTNVILGDCEGDCSTMESKYRFEWKYLNDIPAGLDPKSLVSKNFGNQEHPRIKYQVVIANAADKRNTVRKMAQKRAFIGATVLATATSDLFTADELPEDEPPPGSTGQPGTVGKTDYGDLISEAQGKRLWAIRSQPKIEKGEFSTWLKAKYGLDSDKEIGKRIYEEICKACESGKLEMPAKPAAEPEAKPTENHPPETQPSGATLSVSQIKAINAAIHENKKTEKQFVAFLEEFSSGYVGKKINDILASDFDRLMEAWDKALKAGVL
jgi:hypothetical protein